MKYFEQKLEELNEKSRKTAWAAFAAACGVSIILAGAIFVMTPLKRTEVRLLVVDKNTGYPTEITTLADFQSGNVKQMTANEALSKYFVQQYIIAHDSYNHYTVRNDWKVVQMYSTPEVFNDYKLKFANGIEERIGKDKVMEVIIHSMNLMPTKTDYNGKNIGRIMQARVEKVVRAGENIMERSTGTVTISFAYDEHLKMDEQSRNTNPLGFTVTAYQYAFDQRTENFPEPQEFYPEPQNEAVELISPKTPETAPQGSVSPASAEVSGNLNSNEIATPTASARNDIAVSGKTANGYLSPETAPQGLPTPAVADNSGETQGQPENKDTTENSPNSSGNLKDNNQGESK